MYLACFLFLIYLKKKSGVTQSKQSCSIICLLVGSEKAYVKRSPILVAVAEQKLGA